MLKGISKAAMGMILLAAAGQADPASDAAYQAGVAAYGAADYQTAIRQAEAAVAADPRNWQAWQLDGNARYALGDKAGAVTVYKYALQINPGNTQLKTFVDSLEGAPAQPAVAAASPAEAVYQSGVAHYTAGDYDTAMKESAEAVRADPNHWQAWSLLGNCRYARTDKRGALEAYDKSLALHPDQPQLKPFRDQLAADVAALPGGEPTAMTPTTRMDPELRDRPARFLVKVWGGYQLGAPAALNADRKKLVEDAKKEAMAQGADSSAMEFKPLSDGHTEGVEGCYVLTPEWSVGVRAGMLSIGAQESFFSYNFGFDFGGGDAYSSIAKYADKMGASLIFPAVGGRYHRDLGHGISVSGGIFLGLGLASASETNLTTFDSTGTGIFAGNDIHDKYPWDEGWSGSGMGADVLAEGTYAINEMFSVGIEVGYRLMKIAKMTADKAVDLSPDTDHDGTSDFTIIKIAKGEPYRHHRWNAVGSGDEFVAEGDPIPFDFSGVVLAVRVSAAF